MQRDGTYQSRGTARKQASMSDKHAYHMFVFGRVQGVGFRAWALSCARRLKVTGWVRNAEDASVEVWAEGARDTLEAFADTLREGPPYGKVDKLVINETTHRNYSSFEILY